MFVQSLVVARFFFSSLINKFIFKKMFVRIVYAFSAGDLVLRTVNIDIRACYL